MGEEIKDCHFTDQWRFYRDGKLFHAEALRMTGDVKEQIAATAGGNNARLLSTIIYAGKDAEEKKGVIKPWLEKASSCTAASCWDDRLVIRILSPHAQSGRSDINHLLKAIRNQPLPRVWQIQ
jgi:urease accessory protein